MATIENKNPSVRKFLWSYRQYGALIAISDSMIAMPCASTWSSLSRSFCLYHCAMIPVLCARIICMDRLMMAAWCRPNAKMLLSEKELARSITKLHGMRGHKWIMWVWSCALFCPWKSGTNEDWRFAGVTCFERNEETIFHTKLRWFRVKPKGESEKLISNVTRSTPCKFHVEYKSSHLFICVAAKKM